MSRHLGDRSAALVDGDLLREERDAALVHVAGCEVCRSDLEAQRIARRALQAAMAPEPGTDLIDRLLALRDQPEPAPAELVSVPASGSDHQPAEHRPARRRTRRAATRGVSAPRSGAPRVGVRNGLPERPAGRGDEGSPAPGSPSRGASARRRHRAGALALGALSLATATAGSLLGVGGASAPGAPLTGPGVFDPRVSVSQASVTGLVQRPVEAVTNTGLTSQERSSGPALIDPQGRTVAVTVARAFAR